MKKLFEAVILNNVDLLRFKLNEFKSNKKCISCLLTDSRYNIEALLDINDYNDDILISMAIELKINNDNSAVFMISTFNKIDIIIDLLTAANNASLGHINTADGSEFIEL